MASKTHLTFLSLVLLSTLLFNCGKKKVNDTNEHSNYAQLNDNVLVVSSDTSNLSLISVDSTQIVFSEFGGGVEKIQVGSILVSTITDKAPNGYLRKVIAVNHVGGQKICITEQASLCDAVKNGSVKFHYKFTDNDIIGIDTSGVDIASFKKQRGLSLTIPFSGQTQAVNIEGSIVLKPELDFDLDINNSTVTNFKTELILNNTNSINIKANNPSANFSKQWVIGTYKLAPIIVWMGPVPIPLAKQWLVLVVGVDGNITAKLEAGAVNENVIDMGVQYTNGVWNNIYQFTKSIDKTPLDINGAATASAWVRPRYEVRPFAVPSSRIFLAAKGSLNLEVKPTCEVIINWGLDVDAKAQMKLFSKTLLDYDVNIFSGNYPIFDGPPIIATTSDITNISQTKAECGGEIKNPFSCNISIIQRGVCWDKSPKPTIAQSKTMDGTGFGTFTSHLTNLDGCSEYYVRSYAITDNNKDTIYGAEKSFSTNCGYHVGDTAFGGIIFYLDPLTSFPNQHGLVCCYPNQISLVASKCFPGPCITPNLGPCPFPYSTDTLIGTGHINTNFIVNKISSGLGSYAALICDNYTFESYTDWFLPSIDELKALYYAKDSIPTLPLLDYWSSSITYNSSNWPNSDLLVVSSFDLQTGNYGMGATGSGGFNGNGYSLPCFNGFCVPIRKF